MARARQFINETISLGKRTVGHPSSSKSPVDKITLEFLEMLEDALATSNNIQDVQSASYLLRIKARAHLALGTRGDMQEAMMNLKEAAAILLRNNDKSNNGRDIKEDGDVLDIQDVYGELGDVFTDLGNYEEAARYYGLALSMDYNT
jgi:tetratricopeptide (TPR) repeat protein